MKNKHSFWDFKARYKLLLYYEKENGFKSKDRHSLRYYKKHPLKFESRFKRLVCKLKGEKYYPNTYMSFKQAMEYRNKFYEMHPFVGSAAASYKKLLI